MTRSQDAGELWLLDLELAEFDRISLDAGDSRFVAISHENVDNPPKLETHSDDDTSIVDDMGSFRGQHAVDASFGSSLGPFTDQLGNTYTINFDAKRYTAPLRFKGKRLVYFTLAFVSLFLSLFGYEQGVCLGILTYHTFNTYFHNPTATEIGVVILILEIGAMASSLAVLRISDLYGRKRTILLGTFIFIVGGTFQLFSLNLWWFGIGRVLLGFGVGILLTIVPLYQCEISPLEDRGKLVCGEFTGNIAGYCLSVWVDYFCYFLQGVPKAHTRLFWHNLSWRLPLFLQVVIGVFLFVGGFFIVESPRWLLDDDDDQRGFHVLALLYDDDRLGNKPVTEFFLIKNSILRERVLTPKHERTYRFMFKRYLLRVLIACLALAFAQFNGINIILYYAPLVFRQAGFNEANALLMTGINGFVYLALTIPPWFLVDQWGRKPILISGGALMCVCLSLIAVVMFLDRSYTANWVAALVIIYNAAFGYLWGPIGFLIPPEVYPLSVRSKGVSLLTASNWLANYIVGQLTPILQASIGWKMYTIPATSCLISIVVVWLFYPETKGVELEDIDELFDEYYKGHKRAAQPTNYAQLATGVSAAESAPSPRLALPHGADSFELDNLDDLDYELPLTGSNKRR